MQLSNYKAFFIIFTIFLTLDCAYSNDDDDDDEEVTSINDERTKFKFYLLMLKKLNLR